MVPDSVVDPPDAPKQAHAADVLNPDRKVALDHRYQF
jgi:hypothetical protein